MVSGILDCRNAGMGDCERKQRQDGSSRLQQIMQECNQVRVCCSGHSSLAVVGLGRVYAPLSDMHGKYMHTITTKKSGCRQYDVDSRFHIKSDRHPHTDLPY